MSSYVKFIDKLVALAKQADFRFEVAVPLTSFDKKTIQEFLKFLKDAEVKKNGSNDLGFGSKQPRRLQTVKESLNFIQDAKVPTSSGRVCMMNTPAQ